MTTSAAELRALALFAGLSDDQLGQLAAASEEIRDQGWSEFQSNSRRTGQDNIALFDLITSGTEHLRAAIAPVPGHDGERGNYPHNDNRGSKPRIGKSLVVHREPPLLRCIA